MSALVAAAESRREFTPRELVAELDRYIVGQHDAKRAVAIALRNRWRRQRLPEELQAEVNPKNILMIGPTGVGKTEIARRLAKLTGAPFIKVEATKYTEVGYYGRDVESMVRELVENAIGLVRVKERQGVRKEAEERAEERLLDLLMPAPPHASDNPFGGGLRSAEPATDERDKERHSREHYARSREKMREMLRAGDLEEKRVEISVEQKGSPMIFSAPGMEHMDFDMQGMLEKLMPRETQRRETTVKEARKVLVEQEAESLLDPQKINAQAIDLAQNLGIIFLDEIDKIVASEGKGADVSRQGVQRDLLPIVEGTTVQTRYGWIKTDHVLFIAAGAFHRAKPSDLMPELQGRFPIRVELKDLTKDDFVRILTEPKSSLVAQYAALIGAEGVTVEFTPDAIDELASLAFQVNQATQNIGARRLYTILERLLEELSFEAPDMGQGNVTINASYVKARLSKIAENEDLSQFIL